MNFAHSRVIDFALGGRERMPQYCKAYRVEDLRKFSHWSRGNVQDLADDDVCFVWDDFTVAKSCFDDAKPIFPEVTEDWKRFCTETLAFEIPEDLKELVAEQASKSGSNSPAGSSGSA